MKKFFLSIVFLCSLHFCFGQENSDNIIPGAYRMDVYLPLLKGKRVGVFANQTSVINQTNLVDTLVKTGINVVEIFSPEHGFRGNADAGEHVGNSVDKETNVPIVSLYGGKSKPDANDLRDLDVLVFDIQDVGVRFYTYINSLQYFMEAAAENGKPLIVLDRPNPNGFYVDGPVLESKFKSGVGKQPIPVVYGMTMGEYAFMISGEHWLGTDAANKKFDYYKNEAQNSVDTPFYFLVIKCLNYDHNSHYKLPVKPSPNLPTTASVNWYPSTCFFEGTNLSEGRGTSAPFQIFGAPSLPENLYRFTPVSMPGATAPKFKNQTCYGWNVSNVKADEHKINLQYLIEAYRLYPEKDNFFIRPKSGKPEDYFFNKLAGNASLMQQLKDGKSEQEIHASWQPELNKFKAIRKKYLLYKDFE